MTPSTALVAPDCSTIARRTGRAGSKRTPASTACCTSSQSRSPAQERAPVHAIRVVAVNHHAAGTGDPHALDAQPGGFNGRREIETPQVGERAGVDGVPTQLVTRKRGAVEQAHPRARPREHGRRHGARRPGTDDDHVVGIWASRISNPVIWSSMAISIIDWISSTGGGAHVEPFNGQSMTGSPNYRPVSDAPHDQRAVLRSKPEAVAEGGFDLHRTGVMGNEIQIAGRIRIVEIDGRRQQLPLRSPARL